MLAALVFQILACQLVDQPLAPAPKDTISLPDLHGKSLQIFPSTASKGVVAFFVLAGCPNADAYAPEMNRIAETYKKKGWQFFLVYSEALYSVPQLVKHSEDFGYTFPSVQKSGSFIALTQVTKSPEVAVLTPRGKLLYHGRIDDRFYALGRSRPQPKVRDLRLTLDAIDAGKPVPHKKTEVVGCYIPMD